jgi:hypothetical protein
MRRLLLPTAALAGALVLGCGDQPVPSEPADSHRPSFRTEQNPEGPGALVLRSSADIWLTISDPDPGLTALIGWTFAELEQVCAGGEPPFPSIENLIVIRPHGTEELPDLHQVITGTREPLLVWQATIPFIDPFAELCNELLPLPHLEGTGNFKRTDNDLATTGTRGNAAHEGIHGQVTSESGDRFNFSGKFHIVILPNGDVRVTFDLQLKPIGQ